MVCTDCHTFDPFFHPLHQPKTPVFTITCLPKSSSFSTLSKILESFHSKTTNRLEFEKRYPNAPYFYGFCHWKTPYFCPACTCLRGMLLPQTRSAEAGKLFCILETESCNLVDTFSCKLNKGDENNISVLQPQPTQLYIDGWTSLEGRADTQAIIPLVKHGRGYILQPPSVWLYATWLSKQMPSVSEAVQAEAL